MFKTWAYQTVVGSSHEFVERALYAAKKNVGPRFSLVALHKIDERHLAIYTSAAGARLVYKRWVVLELNM